MLGLLEGEYQDYTKKFREEIRHNGGMEDGEKDDTCFPWKAL